MKNYILTLVATIIFNSFVFAQANLQWDTRFNGPIANDEGKAITVDASSNVYVTGSSDGPTGASDYLTIKYNENGDTLWSRRFNGSGSGQDRAVAIKVDASGNVYITGNSTGIGTGSDIVTIKYDAGGAQKWVAVYKGGGTTNDIAYNLVIDVFGNVYIIGSSGWNAVVVKYNSAGVQQWYKSDIFFYNPITPETKYHIEINAFNNVVVVVDEPDAVDNYLVWELDIFTGNLLIVYNTPFIQVFRGTPNAMALDGAGNIYVLSTQHSASNIPILARLAKFVHGVTTSSWSPGIAAGGGERISGVDMKLDADLNVYVLCSYYYSGNYDYLIAKYNSSGSKLWEKRYDSGGNIDDIPVSLSLSRLKTPPDIYVTGTASNGNIHTLKYDNNGIQQMPVTIYDCGNFGVDIGSNMVTDKCDNLYITGSSNCSNSFKDLKTIKYSTATPPKITPVDPIIVCPGEHVTLTVDGCSGCTYLWNTGQTTQSIMVSPASTTDYKVTVTNPDNGCSAVSSNVTVTVNPILTPNVSILASLTSICQGQNVIFTPSPTNGGSDPVYQWFVNDSLVGTGLTYSSTALANGAQVYCSMTSNALCANPTVAISNTLTITVLPSTIPGINISASSSSICAGEKVKFTAHPVDGGTLPIFEWFVNGMAVGSNDSIYSTTALTNASNVYCMMTSNAVCPDPATVTSNQITITVNPLLVPGVSVIASSTSICPEENITFTAIPTNGGASPVYQWYMNDSLVGDSSQVYSTTTLTDKSEMYCTMISNALCVNPAMATSNSLIITVKPSVIPSVSITASDSCTLFTATPSNGGTSPFYQWYVNGIPVGNNSQMYSNLTLGDGSEVYCIMTSNADCANPSIAKSNTIIYCVVRIKEYENLGRIVVFPNPANDFFTIEGSGLNSGQYRIHLNNILGQTLIEKSIWVSGQDFAIQLNIEEFSSGNYYVIIYSEMNGYVASVQKQ